MARSDGVTAAPFASAVSVSPHDGSPYDGKMADAVAPPASVRIGRSVGHVVEAVFGAVSAVFVLAALATVPILQFVALGYLLNAARRYATGGQLREAFVGVRQASQVGQYVIGVWLLTLVPRLVVSLRQDALLVDPGAAQAKALAVMTVLLSLGVGWVSLVALSRGGQIQHFFRPIRATRRMVADLREAGWLDRTKERVTRFVAPLQPLQTFSLGLRAYLGAMVWLVLPTTLLAVGRKGGLAVLGGLLLVIVVLHLPFLQMHFAVHGNLRQMFDVRAVREGYRRAPVAYFVALLSTLLLAIPLYLLKVELVPRDALWLPAAVFVLTIFPTKLLTAWAYHRGGKRREPAHPLVVWGMRPPMVAVAALYAFAVFLSQFTGWHGILGLYEHHAFLLPVPF